ncbi:MAG: hypothetical protein JRN07_05090 [Nitrososphaerota archaeon]|nr:hypothetical protein [Nitrososphaerota archaeon]
MPKRTTLAMLFATVGIVAELPCIAFQTVVMKAVSTFALAAVRGITTVPEVSLVVAFVLAALA